MLYIGEFTIKKNAISALPYSFTRFDEFEYVFGNVKNHYLQCAVIETRVNRTWVRLIGMGYDLQLWTPDTRKPGHNFTRPVFQPPKSGSMIKDMMDFRDYNSWLKVILEPWRDTLFANTTLLMAAYPGDKDEMAVVIGYTPSTLEPGVDMLREIIVYRYPKVFHVYNIVEYGRRWYRTQVFSSDACFSYHDMKMSVLTVDGRSVEVYGSTSNADVTAGPSLVIHRYASLHSSVKQTFLPHRLLHGLLPDILIDAYSFWQNEDDSITGYMSFASGKINARSLLNIRVVKKSKEDPTGSGLSLANGVVTRNFILEEPGLEAEEAEFNTTIDPSKPEMHLVNLLLVMSPFRVLGSELFKDFLDRSLQAYKVLSDFPTEPSTVHALIRMLLVLDNISNILAWSKTKPIEGEHTTCSIDLIELPRLRLTFEKKVDADGKIIYACLEQGGMYIAGYEEDLKFGWLLQGLPRVLMLKNVDDEYFALLPGIYLLVYIHI